MILDSAPCFDHIVVMRAGWMPALSGCVHGQAVVEVRYIDDYTHRWQRRNAEIPRRRIPTCRIHSVVTTADGNRPAIDERLNQVIATRAKRIADKCGLMQ